MENQIENTIPEYAHYNNRKIKQAVIPRNITEIKSFAFASCTSLKKVIWQSIFDENNNEKTELVLGSGIFNDCTSLRTITVPGNIKTIPSFFVGGCLSLERAIIEDGVENIEGNAFYCCFGNHKTGAKKSDGLTTIFLPKTIKKLDPMAFWGCDKLKKIFIPNSCKYEKLVLPQECQVIKYHSYKEVLGSINKNSELYKHLNSTCKKVVAKKVAQQTNNSQHNNLEK